MAEFQFSPPYIIEGHRSLGPGAFPLRLSRKPHKVSKYGQIQKAKDENRFSCSTYVAMRLGLERTTPTTGNRAHTTGNRLALKWSKLHCLNTVISFFMDP